MVLFKVNTGCRDQEVCRLRWDWEVDVPELKASVFLIPSEHVKNGEERLVVLNATAKSVIDGERGKHDEFVFTYKGNPVTRIYNSAWKRARKAAGLPQNSRNHVANAQDTTSSVKISSRICTVWVVAMGGLEPPTSAL